MKRLLYLGSFVFAFVALLLSSFAFAALAPQPDPLQPRAAASAAPNGPPPETVLSSQAQALVDQTVAWQKGTGLKWDLLAAEALLTLVKDVKQNGWPNKATCTLDNIYVRREWAALSKQERKDYISAVKCLQSRPSKLDPVQFPGAKNRYDDFVGVHIVQTLSIHFTGNFLTWHRYFTWAYEHTLRNECGYKGYQPYINWGKWAQDPVNSPIFDGSDTSMSGNGKYVPHDDLIIPFPAQPDIIIPAGNGGGCIYSGPFVNWTVNLGPVAPVLTYITPNPRQDGLGYNPRCIVRDVSQYTSSHWTRDIDAYDLITGYTNILAFQNRMQGDFAIKFLGIHGGGHYTDGGDPGGDFYVSPGDPYFFLHHSAIDRLFWTWQNLAPQTRTYVVGGTITFNNTPPSRPAVLDDPIDISVLNLAGVLSIRSSSSALGGSGSPFCYIYA